MIHNTQYAAGGNIETVTGTCRNLARLVYTGVDNGGALVTYDISENIPITFSPIKGTIVYAYNNVGINSPYPEDSCTIFSTYAGKLFFAAEKDGFDVTGW